MLAVCYLLAGLAAVVVGVAGLLGVWWALVVLGVALVILGVLEARGAPVVAAADVSSTEGGSR